MTYSLRDSYNICVEKTRRNINKIQSELREFYASTDGDYFKEGNSQPFLNMYTWTPSFFTGMSLLAYLSEGQEEFIKWANKHYPLYKSKVFDLELETTHDLGFLYSLYSVALYKINGDKNNRKTAIKAADELAKRFSITGGYITAWARMNNIKNNDDSIAIVDCMMNIPLLFWASKETGNSFYRDIAVKHADMTLNLMVRPDWSIYHAYRFNHKTGEPIGGCNYCGYSDESYWARGTSWAIYGFAIAYGYTNDGRYLKASIKLAEKFVNNLQPDYIPVWDFRLPFETPALACGNNDKTTWDSKDISNIKYNRDTSAAAIACCGIMEAAKHTDIPHLLKASNNMIASLCSNTYLDDNLDVPGILKYSNGCMTYTSFGDYFFMEALYRKLNGELIFW